MEKRLPVSASFILVIALAVSLAYWALQLLKAPPRQLAAVPLQSAPPAALDAAASLFGGAATTVAVSNYQLRGVVAAGRGGDSAAIIGVDGKPAVALVVGKDVVPGVTVQEIHPRYVLLSDGGVIKRIELATDNGKAAGLASPLPYVPAAPATQPRPKEGMRFTSGRSPSRDTSRASIEGAAMPVTDVNITKSTSGASRPAAARAVRSARSARSVATSMKMSLDSRKVPRSR